MQMLVIIVQEGASSLVKLFVVCRCWGSNCGEAWRAAFQIVEVLLFSRGDPIPEPQRSLVDKSHAEPFSSCFATQSEDPKHDLQISPAEVPGDDGRRYEGEISCRSHLY